MSLNNGIWENMAKWGLAEKLANRIIVKEWKELFYNSNSKISIFSYFVAKLFRQTAVWHFFGQQPYFLGKCFLEWCARASWKIAYLVKPVISFRHFQPHTIKASFCIRGQNGWWKALTCRPFYPFFNTLIWKKSFKTLFIFIIVLENCFNIPKNRLPNFRWRWWKFQSAPICILHLCMIIKKILCKSCKWSKMFCHTNTET